MVVTSSSVSTTRPAVIDQPRNESVQWQWRGWSSENTALAMCYHAEIGRSRLNTVAVNRGLKFLECWGRSPWDFGAADSLETRISPT